MESLNTKDHRISTELKPIIGAIGEPAAEAIFAGSVSDPKTGKPPIPLASGVLTNYLKTTSIPVLIAKLREGSDEERNVASWALSQITYYHGVGDHDPAELIP